jgi:hypothetical protein
MFRLVRAGRLGQDFLPGNTASPEGAVACAFLMEKTFYKR